MDFTSSVLTFTPSLCVCKKNMHVRRLSGHINRNGDRGDGQGYYGKPISLEHGKIGEVGRLENRNDVHWRRNDFK